MADYTDLPDTAVGIGGIPSGTTVTALRDNPIAITEGAVGAPRIVSGALDLFAVYAGDVTSGVTATFLSETALDGVGILRYDYSLVVTSSASGRSTIQIRMSNNNGSTWSSWVDISDQIGANGATESGSGMGVINLVDGTVRGQKIDYSVTSAATLLSATVLVGGGNAIEVRTDVGAGNTTAAQTFMVPICGRGT